MAPERQTSLPEVTLLRDARGERPEGAAGVGGFWYDPAVWALPISPAARVLYAGLCSFVAHGEINRKDLRGALKDSPDAEISSALDELISNGLLAPQPAPGGKAAYSIRPVEQPR